jgi:hypothetical protein
MKKNQIYIIIIFSFILLVFVAREIHIKDKQEVDCYNNLYNRVEIINTFFLSTKYNNDIKKIQEISDFDNKLILDNDYLYETINYLDSVNKDIESERINLLDELKNLKSTIDSFKQTKTISNEHLKNIIDGLKIVEKNSLQNYEDSYLATSWLKSMFEFLRDCDFSIDNNNQIEFFDEDCHIKFQNTLTSYNYLIFKMMKRNLEITSKQIK